MPRSLLVGLLSFASLVIVTGNHASAQGVRFRADWLFLRRDGDAPSSLLISGPDAFSSGADFNFESGYRLFLSAGTEQFDVEATYSRLNQWETEQGAILFNELSFDSEFNNPLVIAAPPANRLPFNNRLSRAAEFNGGMFLDETTEGELLDAMSDVIYEVQTDYSDFDLTVKTSRCNWYRFGIGYRHIQFDESNALGIMGMFSAIDADDGALPGDLTNDDNDILSHAALASAGLTRVGGAANGFAHGDNLLLQYDSLNDNRLNGAHITFDGTLLDSYYFLVELYGNVGLFHNDIDARLIETYTGTGSSTSVYRVETQDTTDDLAWATQWGLRGAVKLTDHWKVHLGYEVLFIDGLALGANHPRVTPFNTISVGADQSVTIHGGRLGIEGVW